MVLYQGPGAGDYEIGAPSRSPEAWARVKTNACRYLRATGATDAASFFEQHNFRPVHATNHFHDEFEMLALEVSMEDYVSFTEWQHRPENRSILSRVVRALEQFGVAIRIVGVDMRLDDAIAPVAAPELREPSATVERALDDAQNLIATSGPASAVDRVHTALHAYLRDLSRTAGMPATEVESATIQRLLTWLSANHPRFAGDRPEEIRRILRAFGAITESLGQFRNHASLAHPNSDLLGDAEAMLAINSVRTIMHYIAEKLSPPSA